MLHKSKDKVEVTYALLSESGEEKEEWNVTAMDMLSFARQVALAMVSGHQYLTIK